MKNFKFSLPFGVTFLFLVFIFSACSNVPTTNQPEKDVTKAVEVTPPLSPPAKSAVDITPITPLQFSLGGKSVEHPVQNFTYHDDGTESSEGSTYLSRTFQNYSGDPRCHRLDVSYVLQGEDEGFWEQKNALEQIATIVPDATKQTTLVDFLTPEFKKNYYLMEMCLTDTNVYAVLMKNGAKGENQDELVFTSFDTDITNPKKVSLPVLKVADGSYTFVPDVDGNKSIIGTGFGDAGIGFWTYYTAERSNWKLHKIESCIVELTQTGNDHAFGCELEYIPPT